MDILNRSSNPIAAVDVNGKTVGRIVPRWFTDEQIADAERRLDVDEPCVTTAELLQHLRLLER